MYLSVLAKHQKKCLLFLFKQEALVGKESGRGVLSPRDSWAEQLNK